MSIELDDMKTAILDLRAALLGSAAEKQHSRQAVLGLRLERLLFITNDYEFSRDMLLEIARIERELRIDLTNSFIAICQMLHSGKLDGDSLKQIDPVLKQGFKNINPIYIYGDRLQTGEVPDLLRLSGANMAIGTTRSLAKIFQNHFCESVLIFVLNGKQGDDLSKTNAISNGNFGGLLLGDVKIISVNGDLKPFFKAMVFSGVLKNFRQFRFFPDSLT